MSAITMSAITNVTFVLVLHIHCLLCFCLNPSFFFLLTFLTTPNTLNTFILLLWATKRLPSALRHSLVVLALRSPNNQMPTPLSEQSRATFIVAWRSRPLKIGSLTLAPMISPSPRTCLSPSLNALRAEVPWASAAGARSPAVHTAFFAVCVQSHKTHKLS